MNKSLSDLYLLQPYKNDWVKVKWNRGQCAGLSVDIPEFREYCLAIENPSAVMVIGDLIFVNDSGNLTYYDYVKWHNVKGKGQIEATGRISGNDWSYFIAPIDDKVIWGQSIGGYGKRSVGCAYINQLSVNESNFNDIRPDDCAGGKIKEWYSIIKFNGSFFMGNFPEATIYKYENGKIKETEIAAPEDNDFRDAVFNTTYRESQSLSYSSGFMLIGMYPWGELILSDGFNGKERIVRLFDLPPKAKNIPTPYFDKFLDEFGSSYKRTPNTEVVYSYVGQKGQSLRAAGTEPTLLGQRVPTIAVLDGRVCASTGSLSFVPPSSDVLSRLGVHDLEGYGAIKCLSVSNQMLVDREHNGDYILKIFEHGMKLYSEGALYKSVIFKSDLEIKR